MAMRGRLLYRDAQGRDASADLQAEGSFVGRAQECVVRTDDAMVSRRNFRIWRDSGKWFVEDLGSSNGTFVNDQRIQARQALRHADIVRCGTLQVRFVEVEDAKSDRVDVDPSLMGGESELDVAKRELESVLADRSEKEQRLFELTRELDALRLRNETDATELQRLRAEVAVQRDKASELSRDRQLHEEELHAQLRVGEQLRRELDGLKKDHVELRERFDKTVGDLQARDRQLERAGEDIQRAKQALDELRARAAELEKTKDAGWRELNSRVGELDGLRAVISEQERLLEERRVGLISLEASAQELRQEKERLLRELVGARSEREEAKTQLLSTRNQLDAFEEEHRRLQRALSQGSGGGADESMRLATDLRQARVALKTIEAERDRFTERAERAEIARTEVEQKLARLEVERMQALEEKQRAVSARERAEEALARGELQRKAADETRKGVEAAEAKRLLEVDRLRRELDEAKQALDEAKQALDEAKQEIARAAAKPELVVRAPKRTEQRTMPSRLDGATAPIDMGERAGSDGAGDFQDEMTWDGQGDRTGGGAVDAELRIGQLEEELANLGSELAIAKAELEGARAAAPASGESDQLLREIQRRAEEAYNGVNDALSELRTNVLLARQLVGELGAESETTHALAAAISSSVDRAEDAKGILRVLREVALA